MNPPTDPEDSPAPLTDAARGRLVALLRDELTRASADALADGTPADALAAQIEARIAELQRQLAAPTRNARP